jgi:hypothetical protein
MFPGDDYGGSDEGPRQTEGAATARRRTARPTWPASGSGRSAESRTARPRARTARRPAESRAAAGARWSAKAGPRRARARAAESWAAAGARRSAKAGTSRPALNGERRPLQGTRLRPGSFCQSTNVKPTSPFAIRPSTDVPGLLVLPSLGGGRTRSYSLAAANFVSAPYSMSNKNCGGA